MSASILMRKKTAIGRGHAPVGEEIHVFLPLRDRSNAEPHYRAWRIFSRDRPDENPLDWEIVVDGARGN